MSSQQGRSSSENIYAQVIDLIQRVARLEERTTSLERDVTYIKKVLTRVDSRLWYVVAGIATTILTQIVLSMLG